MTHHNQSISDGALSEIAIVAFDRVGHDPKCAGVQPWILTAMRYAIQKAVAAERDYEIDKLRLRCKNAEGMADCMDMVRQDLINMGIIGDDVAPMFIPEAVAGAIQKAVAAEREACAVIAETGGGGKEICHLIAAEIRKRAIKTEAKEPA